MDNTILREFNKTPIRRKLNYILIPTSIIKPSEEGVSKFNKLIDFIHTQGYNKITRTKCGGICLTPEYFTPPMYDIRSLNSCVELTLITYENCYRIQFRQNFLNEKENGISGSKAFKGFVRQLSLDGVDLDKYAIDNGKDVKNTIEKQKRLLLPCRENKVYTNAHHIDFHSAYMSGVAINFPEFKKTIERIYFERKDKPINKGILTHTWGYMQSALIGYKFAHISKAGIEWTNKALTELGKRLEDSGRFIICYNADGIWYSGEVYHGDGEGKTLGTWDNDHINCKIKFKSIACYGYEENNKFKVVASGKYSLEKVKPREEWTMADLDNLGNTWGYYFNKETEHITRVEENG